MAKKKIGELLIDNYEITEQQLKEALEVQKTSEKLIGIILIELGYIDKKTLEKYLIMQTEIVRKS